MKTYDQDLLEQLANATATYYGCGGHTKAAMNKQRMEELRRELESRGVTVPDDHEMSQQGIFNGPGSR